MPKPKMIGSINCFVASRARIGTKAFTFNGTTKDLVIQSVKHGAKAGARVQADFGGGMRAYQIEDAPHDDRCGGFWASRV